MGRLQTVRAAILLLGVATLAAGCKTTPPEPSEPSVRVVEVKVPQPVPCPALVALGPEPVYPDTDEAIRAASNIAERAKLVATGRLMRIQRLAEYAAAKTGCIF